MAARSSHPRRRRLVVLLLAVAWAAGARADAPPASEPVEPAAPARPDRHPDLQRLSRTGELWLDRPRREVVVGGRVVLATGAIEVFACPEKTKEHEAIVATRCTAFELHAALLAIGLEPGAPVRFDPQYVAARGPRVRVRVRWRDADGKPRECAAQEWIRDTATGAALAADWVFAGSDTWRDGATGREHYQADGGDMICVSNFPTALLDLPIESSQSNEALLFEAFEGRVPPQGTDVELVLTAAP